MTTIVIIIIVVVVVMMSLFLHHGIGSGGQENIRLGYFVVN